MDFDILLFNVTWKIFKTTVFNTLFQMELIFFCFIDKYYKTITISLALLLSTQLQHIQMYTSYLF